MSRTLPVAFAVLLADCSWLAPYRMDIQQGNFVSQEMVLQLKRGMTKDQVRYLLGTPLVTDVFHGDRWDYVYLLQRPGAPRVQRRVSVYFAEDRVTRVDGDMAATAEEPEVAR